MTGRVLSEEELKEAEFVQLPIVHNLIATIRDRDKTIAELSKAAKNACPYCNGWYDADTKPSDCGVCEALAKVRGDE